MKPDLYIKILAAFFATKPFPLLLTRAMFVDWLGTASTVPVLVCHPVSYTTPYLYTRCVALDRACQIGAKVAIVDWDFNLLRYLGM